MTLSELLYKVNGELPDEIDAEIEDVLLDVKVRHSGRLLDLAAVSFDGENTLVIETALVTEATA